MDKCDEKAEGAHKSDKILEEKLVCGEQYHLGGGEGVGLPLWMLESAVDWSRFPLPFATEDGRRMSGCVCSLSICSVTNHPKCSTGNNAFVLSWVRSPGISLLGPLAPSCLLTDCSPDMCHFHTALGEDLLPVSSQRCRLDSQLCEQLAWSFPSRSPGGHPPCFATWTSPWGSSLYGRVSQQESKREQAG